MGEPRAGGDKADVPPELADLAERYAGQPMALSEPEVTTRLLERLFAVESLSLPPQSAWRWRPAQALRVARWRLRLLGPSFWCAGVVLLAFVGAYTINTPQEQVALPLVLMGPLTMVLGLAHALRTTSRGLREIEASAPVSFAEVSSGLVMALVAFDSLLCVAVSAALALARLAPFAGLIAAWSAPLLLLAGISLVVALRFGVRAAALVGAGPWLLLALYSLLSPQAAVAALFTAPTDIGEVVARLLVGLVGLMLLLWPLGRGAAWRAAIRDTSTAA
jgi:hypothetical protein